MAALAARQAALRGLTVPMASQVGACRRTCKPSLFAAEVERNPFVEQARLRGPACGAAKHLKESAAKFLKKVLAPSTKSRYAVATMAAAGLIPGQTIAHAARVAP